MRDTEGHRRSTRLAFPLKAPNCSAILKFNKEPLTCWIDQGMRGPCSEIPSHGLDVAHRWLPSPGPAPWRVFLEPRPRIPNSPILHLSTWEAAGRERRAPHSSSRGAKAEELQKLYLVRELRKHKDRERTPGCREGFLQEDPLELECRMGRKEEGTARAEAARCRSTRCGSTASVRKKPCPFPDYRGCSSEPGVLPHRASFFWAQTRDG